MLAMEEDLEADKSDSTTTATTCTVARTFTACETHDPCGSPPRRVYRSG